MTKTRMLTAVALTATAATAANAGMSPAQPITLGVDSSVAVEFVSQSAGARGSLYFMGYENDGQMFSSISSDSNGLGQFLFQNHGTSSGTTVQIGEFGAGSTLHFAYLVTQGVPVAPTGSLFRTDDDSAFNFALAGTENFDGTSVTRVGIEDITDEDISDFDFNDIIFNVRSTAIPAPGSVALALTGVALVARRRKS